MMTFLYQALRSCVHPEHHAFKRTTCCPGKKSAGGPQSTSRGAQARGSHGLPLLPSAKVQFITAGSSAFTPDVRAPGPHARVHAPRCHRSALIRLSSGPTVRAKQRD